MSIRRLAGLIRQLPLESATAAATHGPAAEWSTTDHLLAHIGDLLANANWQRGGDKTKPRPKLIDRPGDSRRLHLSGQEMQRRLLEQRAKG